MLVLFCLGPSTGLLPSEASFLGGMRSFSWSRSEKYTSEGFSRLWPFFDAHSPLASSKEVILWFGENPCSAPIREAFPPDRAPRGRAPVGVRPLSCRTCSDSSLKRWDFVKNLTGFRKYVYKILTWELKILWPSSR